MAWGLNLKGKTEAELDGARATPGWYLAKLTGTHEDEKGNQVFNFVIQGPTFAGCSHSETLYNPELSTAGAQGLAFLWKKVESFAHRLGLIPKGAQDENFQPQWEKAVGWEGVIHLKDESYTSQHTGKTVQSVKIDYAPQPKDHAAIPPDVRVRLGLPLLPGQTLESAEAPVDASKGKAKGKGGKDYKPSPPPQNVEDVLAGI